MGQQSMANNKTDAGKKPWFTPKLEQLSVRATATGMPGRKEGTKIVGTGTLIFQGPVAS